MIFVFKGLVTLGAASSMAISMLLAVLLAAVSFGGVQLHSLQHHRGIVPGKINVHLVPHSHDDVGWLKTVDQYYVGANNSIRGACVQNVIDSVISALLDDENRKFIYVEMAFFQRWWRQQSKKLQTRVKQLVKSGQLEFINGGMCMHDEATTHYIDLIDQTTLGHRYIKDEFGQTPRVGWQIDPFGHSAVQAYLLGAELGFDSLFFARIDYQDRARRKDEKTLEVVWQGSKSLLSTSQIFTGIFPRHYDPPDGFVFEINDISPPIQDDVLLFDYNVEERVNDFVAAAVSQAYVHQSLEKTKRADQTMLIRELESCKMQRELLKLPLGLNCYGHFPSSTPLRVHLATISIQPQDGRVNALYSTPSIYTDAKYAANKIWPLKRMTSSHHPNAYWTGYFTSRPAFKGYVRMMSSYYLVARQLEFFKGRNSTGPNTDALADALAIAQHHDAVSGTQRQHVAADYAKRLSNRLCRGAEELVSSSLASLAESRLITGPANPITKFSRKVLRSGVKFKYEINLEILMMCPLLNISYCPPSEAVLSDGKSLVVVIYNPLGWKREEVVRIPVSTERLIVHDSSGKEIESQLLPVVNASSNTRNFYVKDYLGKSPSGTLKYWLAFSASVPPLGYSTYIISSTKQTGASSTISMVLTSEGNQNSTIEVGQGSLKLLYSADEGKLTHYINSRSLVSSLLMLQCHDAANAYSVLQWAQFVGGQVTAFAEQSYSYYSGNDGTDKDPQASGAYVFRPNGTFPIKSEGQVPLTVLRGPILDEVHQELNPWIYQVMRIYKGKEHAEVEFTIGPIPVDDGAGKEITTQITTTLKTNKTFYTDSNGRDFIKRIRDYRADWDLQVNQPVAGNYYPINLGIYVQDDSMELSVLVDRSVGGSSLVDGQIELMLHRRLLHDDIRGVGEVLNEEVCVGGQCKAKIYCCPKLLVLETVRSIFFPAVFFFNLVSSLIILTMGTSFLSPLFIGSPFLVAWSPDHSHLAVSANMTRLREQVRAMPSLFLHIASGRCNATLMENFLGSCGHCKIQGKLYIRIDPVGEGAKWRRTFGQEIYSPLLLAFAEQDGNNWMESHLPTFSGLDPSYVLPNNTALITLEELENGKLLLRLAHLYEIGEDKDYSVMATVELKKLLHNIKITKATETSLSANQERSRMENKKLIWEVEGSSEEPKVVRGGPVDPAKLVVELAPMEIRTFLIEYDHLQIFPS
ncbi:Alpha-mannosidase [Vitis vinifera]|uniref:Alpha-mannosidase n=1 Tax=Vitis vinifera TaxID=29760 RepID=A0A438EC64_VITVI|nr:Alpha-mannosidase [Vitis vinifera]